MKRLNRSELSTRLLLVFFTAVFLLSVAHFFVYAHLLNTMEKEEAIINQQQAASAKVRLDSAFAEIEAAYSEMNYDVIFRNLGSLEPDAYKLVEMRTVAEEAYMNIPGVHQWFLVLRANGQVLSKNGVYDMERYLGSFCRSSTYTPEFWTQFLSQSFSHMVLPEAEHKYMYGTNYAESKQLVPMVIRSYYNYVYTTVLLLDMDAICVDSDSYLGENLYLFSETGALLYTTDSTPVIDAVPTAGKITGGDGIRYQIRQWTADNGIQCVKLLTVDQSTDIVRSSFTLCLIIAATALFVIIILVPTTIKSLLHPVNRLLGLLQQHASLHQGGGIHNAYEELEHILKTRDQQTAELARRDATLSEYFLQAQLKNVYVNAEQRLVQPAGTAYILYIQVHYDTRCKHIPNISRPELENSLQDIMSDTLSRLFESTMMLQLEPGRFAARLTAAKDGKDVSHQMDAFMARLQQEQEFAWFTVVLSEPLTEETELSGVYVQVQEAARLALVRKASQFLALPVENLDNTAFLFSRQEEKALHAHIQKRDFPKAIAEAEDILKKNLESGISHAHMEFLCIAIINTVFNAMSELNSNPETLAATNGIYNELTANCSTGQEYLDAVTGFISALNIAPEANQDDSLLSAVQQYLENNYARDFSSEDMAGALWVSRSYLSSYYKAKTGINLSETIQMFRIRKAEALLRDSNVKIGDVGPMVGIPSSNTFLRNFRKYTGMTPSEYRQKECK